MSSHLKLLVVDKHDCIPIMLRYYATPEKIAKDFLDLQSDWQSAIDFVTKKVANLPPNHFAVSVLETWLTKINAIIARYDTLSLKEKVILYCAKDFNLQYIINDASEINDEPFDVVYHVETLEAVDGEAIDVSAYLKNLVPVADNACIIGTYDERDIPDEYRDFQYQEVASFNVVELFSNGLILDDFFQALFSILWDTSEGAGRVQRWGQIMNSWWNTVQTYVLMYREVNEVKSDQVEWLKRAVDFSVSCNPLNLDVNSLVVNSFILSPGYMYPFTLGELNYLRSKSPSTLNIVAKVDYYNEYGLILNKVVFKDDVSSDDKQSILSFVENKRALVREYLGISKDNYINEGVVNNYRGFDDVEDGISHPSFVMNENDCWFLLSELGVIVSLNNLLYGLVPELKCES